MSRTMRTVTKHSYGENAITVTVDDTRAKHWGGGHWWGKEKRMRPYGFTKGYNVRKYQRGEHMVWNAHSPTHRMGNTRAGTKLENANANRSMKKSMRQFLKKELSKTINELTVQGCDAREAK